MYATASFPLTITFSGRLEHLPGHAALATEPAPEPTEPVETGWSCPDCHVRLSGPHDDAPCRC